MRAEVPGGRSRWTICALLVFATTVNYMDRQVVGLLEPILQVEFGWTKLEYGFVTSAFQWAYGIGFLLAGRIVDTYGVKRAFSYAPSWNHVTYYGK